MSFFFLVHPVCLEALPLRTLHKCCEVLINQKHAGNLLKTLFSLIIQEKGPNFLHNLWQSSGLSFSDFLPAQDAEKYIKDNVSSLFVYCDFFLIINFFVK